jgi:pSer/pThr/pTyr-binding forkhead associated (FHA) protein
MPYELTIAEGKGRGQRFEFDSADITIGRDAENDVVLNDPGVSRNHARIKQSGQAYQLMDNGSANGTELNGAVIGRPTTLRDGDRIGVGPIIFRFDGVEGEDALPDVADLPTGADETRITTGPQRPANEETRVSAIPTKGPQPKARAASLKAGGNLVAPQGAQAWFLKQPPKIRYAMIGAVALVLILICASWVKSQKHDVAVCPDEIAMTDDSAFVTVGHGVVDVDCGSRAVFGFNAPVKTRVYFHYEIAHIASASELELKLNGKHLAFAPVVGPHPEEQIVQLPDDGLAADGKNLVSFIESKDKDWSVGHVRADLLTITPGNLADGQAAYERGRRKFEERKVAPRNLYDAWKFFTAARLSLEGLNPRPELYAEVAQLIKDTEKEMGKECSRLIFTANREEKYGQSDRAQQTYREVLTHFPGEDPTGCRKKALDNVVTPNPTPN